MAKAAENMIISTRSAKTDEFLSWLEMAYDERIACKKYKFR